MYYFDNNIKQGKRNHNRELRKFKRIKNRENEMK